MNNERILIFGRPGSGKTSLAVLKMLEALQDGYFVYSNIKINWFGELHRLTKFEKLQNKLYNIFWSIIFPKNKREKKLKKLYEKDVELETLADNTKIIDNIPTENLTDIFYSQYWIQKNIDEIKNIEKNIREGWKKNYYYEKNRYNFIEDLEIAIKNLIDKATENPEEKYLLAFDEGFTELDYSRKVPAYVTNFFNQTRKLNIDVIICSQRPVAVYPSYRALCDYMVLVEFDKRFKTFSSKKFYVDENINALPDTRPDYEGNDKGEPYEKFNIKNVEPFFSHRQSIALKKLINKNI